MTTTPTETELTAILPMPLDPPPPIEDRVEPGDSTGQEKPTRKTPARLKFLGFSCEWQSLRAVLLAYAITRLLIFAIILLSATTFPMRPGDYLYSNSDNLVLDGLIRDDSWWYTNIATRGYSMGNIKTGEQGNTAFFPLYPLTVKMVAGLTGDPFLAGLLVSNLAFLVALSFLYGLVRHEFDHATASRAIFYLAAAPTAVFFSAMYTESLYMAAIIGAFYYASQRQWDRAALCGVLASATRNTGVLVVFVLALEGLHQQGVRWWPRSGWRRRQLWSHYKQQLKLARRAWPSLLAAAFSPLGLVAYMAYLSNNFGDPLGFIHVQATWGREVSGGGFLKLFGTIKNDLRIGSQFWAGQFNPGGLLNLLATLGFLGLVIMVCRKLRPAYAVYSLLTFLIPLTTGTIGSMTRYILMLVPCFILLALWGRQSWVDRLVMGIFLPLMGYMAIVFSHWYFAG